MATTTATPGPPSAVPDADTPSARDDLQQPRRAPGESGVWVLVFGDLLVFCTLFAAFLYYRADNETVFRTGQEQLSQTAGAINTLLLLTSSLLVVGGVRAYARRREAIAGRFFLGALLCGLAFVASKYFEYSDKVDAGLRPSTDFFFQYYYLMTGLHLFHLAVGLGCLAFMIVQTRSPRTDRGLLRVEVSATYWHMVDLIWIFLFALLYMVH
jgi:nitric oxide reductase NorE protein